MGRVAVIGQRTACVGYALAGATVLAAEDDAAVRHAWRQLPADVELVLLTAAAAAALAELRPVGRPPLTAVLPG
ncbi:V-type ATP synthase subunit F [Rhodococcus sp. X156]|uniref:V-type ATP synthase subunit F n=1 Tax=Rhodococcus sp. X156 TaxID=2499145 RepID=UPI000FD737DF|nr:V-type ATP synthase subunit F [Rhodococcus sp. X156]